MRVAADRVAGPDGATSPTALDPPARADVCRNCGAHAAEHFCGNCGQETRVALPTFGTFMREAAGRYVALDGRLWRTLFALIARPGFLTREYLSGRRRRYIRPARLFLVLWLLLFAVVGLLQSPTDLADEIVFLDSDKANTALSAELARAGVKGKASPDTTENPARAKGLSVLNDDDDLSALFGVDKEGNIEVRFFNVGLPVPAQVRKRYEHFKKLSHEEQAEQLYAGVLRFGP
jgi:hypothetical protein